MNITKLSQQFTLLACIALTATMHAAPGDLDLTFGTGGKVTTDIGSITNDGAHDIAIQTDGKILVAGSTSDGTKGNFALVRYTATGTLDPSFGSGGKVTTAIGSRGDGARSIIVQADGRILVAGNSNSGTQLNPNLDFALVRYTSAGALDTTFGTGGKVTTPIGSSDDVSYDLAVQADGKILVVGYTVVGSDYDLAMVRYTATGALDTTFGTGGKVVTPVGTWLDIGRSVTVQADGKIVVVGNSANSGNPYDFAVVRYTSAGALDTSFGTGGKVTTPIGTDDDRARGVVVLGDGKIVVSGDFDNGTHSDFAVVRYTAAGALDATFGTGGKATTVIGGISEGGKMALQPDGKILLTGSYFNGSNYDLATVRFTAVGSLDTTFGTSGKVTTPIGSLNDLGAGIALQEDRKIVVAGSTTVGTTSDFAVVRYLGDEPLAGPAYPAPGGTTFSGSGTAGRNTGRTLFYSGFNAAHYYALAFAHHTISNPWHSTQGGATGNMTFQSYDAGTGVATFVSSANAVWPQSNGTASRPTRMKVQFQPFTGTASGLLGAGWLVPTTAGAANVPGLPANWPVLDVAALPDPDRYQIWVRIEDTTTGTALLDYYDAQPTLGGVLNTGFSGGFYSRANLAPVVTLNGATPLTFEAAASYIDSGASASDAEEGILSPTQTSNTVVSNIPGTYSVTWNATDSKGLTATVTRTVTVQDTTAPTLTVPGNITVEAASAAGAAVTYETFANDSGTGVAAFSAVPFSGSTFPIGTTTVNLSAADYAGNSAAASFTVRVQDTTEPSIGGTFAPLSIVVGTVLPNYTGQVVTSDAVGVTNVTQSPAPGTLSGIGVVSVTLTAHDAAGNTADVSFNVTVTPTDPQFSSFAAKGGAVPDAGTDARIQTGAVWASFGTPAVNDAGQVAFLGKWSAPKVGVLPAQSGAGIFVDDTLLVKVGASVPGMSGVVFKSFKDPVLNAAGDVGFIATVSGTGITSLNDSVAVLYTVSTVAAPELRVIAQEGTAAPTGDGALWNSFTSIAVTQVAGSSAYCLEGRLRVTSGTPAVTSTSDSVVVIGMISGHASGPLPMFVAMREGGSVMGATVGETLKSWRLLASVSGSPGQGRALSASESPNFQITLSSGRQALAYAGAMGSPVEAGTLSGSLLDSDTLDEASWKSFGALSSSHNGFAMKAVLVSGTGGVISANATGVFLKDGNNSDGWVSLARFTDTAPGLPAGAAFSAMLDPVLAADGLGIAFAGTAKGGGLVSTNDQGIWWKPEGETLALLAREGAQPPDAPAGAEWKAFTSFAMPGGARGPLFTATLRTGLQGTAGPGGITSAGDLALYGTSSEGILRELIREGQPLLGKTVKTFNALKAASGATGSSRAFNSAGDVAVQVSFTDGSTGIVKIALP